MADRIETIRWLRIGLSWLSAGAVGFGCQNTAGSQETSPNQVCATLANNDEIATASAPTQYIGLRIPSTIEVHGKTTASTVLLEFRRPMGPLRCRYQPSSNLAATLVGCDPSPARAGDVVTSDQLALRAEPALGTLGKGVKVTACADTTLEPPTVSSLPPGFTQLPNGEIARPVQKDGVRVESSPVRFGMTGELETEYRGIAVQDARVKTLLGNRFAYIFVETVEPPKGQERDSIHVKLWFFSHTANQAVIVTLKNGIVESVEVTKKVPPEGRQEILDAVDLARRDPALVGRLGDLEGGGMLAQPATGDEPWIGNRVMDIRFYDANLVSKFMATVDLTRQQVLRAAPVD